MCKKKFFFAFNNKVKKRGKYKNVNATENSMIFMANGQIRKRLNINDYYL